MTAAHDILTKAAGHMQDRASTYDKPEGERSMAQTVAIFNLYHDLGLTEAQGWHLLQILKDVRLFTSPGYHADSAEDCVAYAALKAEALHGAAMAGIPQELLGNRQAVEWNEAVAAEVSAAMDLAPAADWPNEQRRTEAEDVVIWPTDERIDAIGQNGGTGEHYRASEVGCSMCHGAGDVPLIGLDDHSRAVPCPACLFWLRA